MTKRRLESELEELSEELLGDLTSSERLEIALTASAAGKADWMTQLSETCPRARYDQPEMAFTTRKRFAFTLAQQAVYDLRTAMLRYGWTKTKSRIRTVLTFCSDLDPEAYGFEHVPRQTRAVTFRELYVSYEMYTQFAEAELGVELEEWLALHPDGPATVVMTEMMLEESAEMREFAEVELADENGEEVPLDDVADQRVDELRSIYQEVGDNVE